jgi:hypothetical protein
MPGDPACPALPSLLIPGGPGGPRRPDAKSSMRSVHTARSKQIRLCLLQSTVVMVMEGALPGSCARKAKIKSNLEIPEVPVALVGPACFFRGDRGVQLMLLPTHSAGLHIEKTTGTIF